MTASEQVVDWEALRAEAVRMTTLAYAPYSHFRVGVAGLVDDGRVVSGCNVENAAYGVTLCAECGMVSQLHATGGGRLGYASAAAPNSATPFMSANRASCGRQRGHERSEAGGSVTSRWPAGERPGTPLAPPSRNSSSPTIR